MIIYAIVIKILSFIESIMKQNCNFISNVYSKLFLYGLALFFAITAPSVAGHSKNIQSDAKSSSSITQVIKNQNESIKIDKKSERNKKIKNKEEITKVNEAIFGNVLTDIVCISFTLVFLYTLGRNIICILILGGIENIKSRRIDRKRLQELKVKREEFKSLLDDLETRQKEATTGLTPISITNKLSTQTDLNSRISEIKKELDLIKEEIESLEMKYVIRGEYVDQRGMGEMQLYNHSKHKQNVESYSNTHFP